MREKYIGAFMFTILIFTSFYINPFVTKVEDVTRPLSQKDEKSQFKSLSDVHNVIWRQVNSLQEEGDCESKKILVCENKASYAGFGSMVMRYGACIQLAYALGRIYFIRQKEYAHFGGLSQWLREDSVKCGYLLHKYQNDSCNLHKRECYLENGCDVNNTIKALEYTPNMRFPAPRQVPGSIPKSLNKVLLSFNIERPWLWFTSQFVGYLVLRPNVKFRKLSTDFGKIIKYQHPVAAMHIRRGDKIGKEFAHFIPVSEFLKAADQYYDKKFPKITIRRMYIASDDKNIDIELKNSTKNKYEFSKLPESYLKKALHPYKVAGFPKEVIESILLDLYFLTEAEYTICTYTSNVCRLIHSLKLSSYPYTTENLLSIENRVLSFFWWFGYSAPFATYWVSKRSNNVNKTFLDGNTLMTYETGTLFNSHGSKILVTDAHKSVSVLDVNTVYKFSEGKRGYVYTDDLIKWPGEPEYHFYEN